MSSEIVTFEDGSEYLKLEPEETGLKTPILIPHNDIAKNKHGGERCIVVLPPDEN